MTLINDELIHNLIEEIEKRPPLYKKNLKEYSDANVKRALWLEVCEVVVPGWNLLDRQEKLRLGWFNCQINYFCY